MRGVSLEVSDVYTVGAATDSTDCVGEATEQHKQHIGVTTNTELQLSSTVCLRSTLKFGECLSSSLPTLVCAYPPPVSLTLVNISG